MTKNINKNFELLTESILEQSEKYEFNLNQLPNVNEFRTDIRQDENFKQIFSELNKKESNCIYWFECESIQIATELNNLLDSKRNELKFNQRVVPVINKNIDSKIIYVGIRRGGKRKYDGLTNIAGRIIQHLGYYIKGSTQGLQLVHWTEKKNLNIKLNVIEFKELPNEYLNVVEKLVAYKLKPLCGKH
ncbi:hypothetical protein BA195_13955 [Tenacibaculum soleae]|uniref:Uncharacterized protein n=1 Tax=Tenacibaculum soleae TaxID=447689 RepID=A0A1B9XYQ4_9FLAO|nr:hypothetical protein [Tenacibaculum soleae]OCK42680.1 hypothetical protein BA195_13955 [Tenacibaculum soleae]